jgi:hypothetical protein
MTRISDADPKRQRFLLTKEEVKRSLGIGDAAFGELGVPYVVLGKRRRYVMDDVMRAINDRKQEGACHFERGRVRRTGGTTSRSAVTGFEEALKQQT